MFLFGRDVDEHQRLAVASQAVLQEMSQFRIPEQISTLNPMTAQQLRNFPIGNVGVLLSESHDDVAQV